MTIDLKYRPGEGLPLSALERVRAEGPIVWSEPLGGWVVWSYDDVRQVIVNSSQFTSEGTPIAESRGPKGMLVTDSPLHNKMRGVWAKYVSMPAMEARTKEVDRIARSLLEPVAASLKAGETVQLGQVFRDFNGEVITWLAGIARERVRDLQRWNRMLLATPVLAAAENSPEDIRNRETKVEYYAFLRDEMQKRRERLAAGHNPDDVMSLMVAAEGRGEGITPDVAIDNLLNFINGAMETTARWLGNILVVLDRYPEALAEVRADRTLMSSAFEEIMRFETVGQLLLRIVKGDATALAGRTLKARENIYVLVGTANRDPNVFERPEVFDIRRQPNPHLGFGYGMHHCLGASIARTEVRSFMNLLWNLCPPLEIVSCDYGDSWALFGPVELNVRAAA